ncbi:hypothetical protein ADP71_17080 [Vitreoscilla sp. C1]|uniref:hypothetical protein n=1 Tax=Vitreoscilla sp. (strain C1) TaxID=96942 RepID=UPI000CDC8F22|nr:hypothetical protein [Vitreoscilla sp. C1]AUZ05235.1 hypothetical protein ADP71_17080 [Vitreoscilla sp. C1]
MANQKFLIVVEGEKAEVQIIQSLKNSGLFPVNNEVIAYCGDIYQLYNLYKRLSEDDGLDIIGLLIAQKLISSTSKRDDFAEIYLFFDYDIQALTYKDDQGNKTINVDLGNEQINRMLEYFDDETGNGKLFISYPMVESVKKCLCYPDLDTFIECRVEKIYDYLSIFKQHYRQHAFDVNCGFSRIDLPQWIEIIDFSCKKSNALTTGNKNFPVDIVTQYDIFLVQKGRYIYLLSAFPLMLLHYYGSEKLQQNLLEARDKLANPNTAPI